MAETPEYRVPALNLAFLEVHVGGKDLESQQSQPGEWEVGESPDQSSRESMEQVRAR